MKKLHHLAVFLPQEAGHAVRANAIQRYGSVSKYLKALIERDQADATVDRANELRQIRQSLEQLLEFAQYGLVVQNATADRLGSDLLNDVQRLYREKFGSAPDAR